MKKVHLTLCAFLCAMSISCSAQKMLSDVSSMEGVSSVFIGSTMLSLAGGASMNITSDNSSIDLTKLLSKISSIEIVSSEDRKAAKNLEKKCRDILKQYPFELITETSSDGDNVQISGVFDKEGKNIEKLLIAVTEPDEVSFILITGDIDLVTLNGAIVAD